MEGIDQPTAAIVHNNIVAASLAAAAAGGASKKAAADALRRLEGLFERTDGRLNAALEVWDTPLSDGKPCCDKRAHLVRLDDHAAACRFSIA